MKERVEEESRRRAPACQETGAQEQQGQSAGILGSVGGPARTHDRDSPWMLAARGGPAGSIWSCSLAQTLCYGWEKAPVK